MLMVMLQLQNLPTTFTTANEETTQDVKDKGRGYTDSVASYGYVIAGARTHRGSPSHPLRTQDIHCKNKIVNLTQKSLLW